MKKLIIFIFLFLYYNFAVDFEGLVLLLFSCSVVSYSLRPHGLQHASLLKLMSIESMMPMQPSHCLSSPSLAFSLSQHQDLF